MSDIDKYDALNVLVVDDSALMRNLVSRIVDADPGLKAAATAMNGRFALQKLSSHAIDAIVLDLEMPEMNGIEFLRARRDQNIEIPVIILSSVAQKGASITMEALNLGAADFIMKPSGAVSEDIHLVGTQLVELLRFHGKRYRTAHGGMRPSSPQNNQQGSAQSGVAHSQVRPAQSQSATTFTSTTSSSGTPSTSANPSPANSAKPTNTVYPAPGRLEIVAIGISTGGPNALRQVFAQLDAKINVPILVVQHMPAGFTAEFAKSLNSICPLEVKEAADGDVLKPGRILIAPGDMHLRIEKRSLAVMVCLDHSDAVNGHRPSADVLFESVAQIYGNRAMGIIMTGMGKDGADKLGLIRKAGGVTLGQDESSCVVYGMPKVAHELGHVGRQVPLTEMAETINEQVRLLGGMA